MSWLVRHRASLIVALLALAATGTSLGHDFTYDDRYVILGNDFVHHLRGLAALWKQTYWPAKFGADGYRPVVMTLFTLQWVTGAGAAWVFHLGNIVLAMATAVAVRWCAAAILPEEGAFVAGALFAVHPVHVEVTGNVVGQSELVVALCLSVAVGLYLRRRLQGTLPVRDAAAIVALFACGLFTKEHAIVLPALLVAAELTVLDRPDWRTRVRELRPLALALVAVALTWFYVRSRVEIGSGFLAFPVFRFLHLGFVDRTLTMMTEVPRIARLLTFPVHMSGDYSPLDVVVANGFDPSQLAGIMITLGIVILAVALRRRAPVVSFALLWVMIAYLPVSNILLPAGFITAERTLFFPSIGVVLLAGAVVQGWLLASSRPRDRQLAYAVVALFVALGIGRSVTRQRVWKNNDVFVNQLVADAPNGYRAHYVRGRHLALKGDGRGMELEYRRAMRLFPYDAAMTLSIADAYTRAGIFKPAADLFEWTYSVEPNTGEGRYEYVYSLVRLNRWDEARRQAVGGIALVAPSDVKRMHQVVVAADSALHVAAVPGSTTLAKREVCANCR